MGGESFGDLSKMLSSFKNAGINFKKRLQSRKNYDREPLSGLSMTV